MDGPTCVARRGKVAMLFFVLAEARARFLVFLHGANVCTSAAYIDRSRSRTDNGLAMVRLELLNLGAIFPLFRFMDYTLYIRPKHVWINRLAALS